MGKEPGIERQLELAIKDIEEAIKLLQEIKERIREGGDKNVLYALFTLYDSMNCLTYASGHLWHYIRYKVMEGCRSH